jgi:hypothetical protein
MYLSCVAALRIRERGSYAAVPLSLRMELGGQEVCINAGSSQVLGVTDDAPPGEICLLEGEKKIAKLFVELADFELGRPVGGIFVVDKMVMRLRSTEQLLTGREFNCKPTFKPGTLVLKLVVMRTFGDKRDNLRGFREIAEKLMAPGDSSKENSKLMVNAREGKESMEQRGLRELREDFERRLAEKDTEMEELRRELARLRSRIEARLASVEEDKEN